MNAKNRAKIEWYKYQCERDGIRLNREEWEFVRSSLPEREEENFEKKPKPIFFSIDKK